MASWVGPVNATLDPFDDKGTLSPLLDSEMHIQNIYVLPARTSYTDNYAIKEAILDNPNSVVLITGKGNETRQKIGKKFMPCLTDTQYALEALEEYNKKIG